MDPEHAARGLRSVPNPALDARLAPSPKTLTVEMSGARAGYAMLAGKVPFSVVPGNHDYDAQWTDARYSPAPDSSGVARPYMLHPGGLNNWKQIFGDQSSFFKDQPWYVAAYNGGADSAQIFTAGGYKAYSTELPDYARWYRALEKPLLSDEDFLLQDEFTIQLDDFRERFGAATARRRGTSGAEKANEAAQRGR